MESLPIFLKQTAEIHLGRLNAGLRGGGRSLDLAISAGEDEWNSYLSFAGRDEKAALVIPRLRRDKVGNLVIGDRNDRAMCPFMIVTEGQPRHTSYDELVATFLSCNIEELFPMQGRKVATSSS